MSVFQPQMRTLKPDRELGELAFPSQVQIKFRFGPEDAFGLEGNRQRTTIARSSQAKFTWNAMEGVSSWQAHLIDRTMCEFAIGQMRTALDGNELTFEFEAISLDELERCCAAANFALPPLLSRQLGIFVWIKHFTVFVGHKRFRYEITNLMSGIKASSADQTIEGVKASVRTLPLLSSYNARIFSAMYYYRQAIRLESIEPDTQAMASEVILNLTKAIEAAFGTSSRDKIRKWCRDLGFSNAYIETSVIPLFLLRNELDVAHVSISPLSSDERASVVQFMKRATFTVNDILSRVEDLLIRREIALPPTSERLDRKKAKLIKSIQSYASSA